MTDSNLGAPIVGTAPMFYIAPKPSTPNVDDTGGGTSVPYQMAAQQLTPGVLIDLFILDASSIGGGLTYFTSGVLGLVEGEAGFQAIQYQGNTYEPLDFKTKGWEYSANGRLPTPEFTVSNVNAFFTGLVITYNDLVNAKLIRFKVFSQYLDGQEQADPNCHFPYEIYYVDQKTSQTKKSITWKLMAMLDQRGKRLPGRQVLKNICTFVYRVWNGAEFAYFNGEMACPYTGTNYFDNNGATVTDPSLDVCSHRLQSGCIARFGKDAPLPFSGQPGAGNFST